MIAANELRIGNWFQCDVWDNGKIEYFKVRSVSTLTIYAEGHEGTFGGIDGIPLTPEILEKCGFEKDGQYFYLEKILFAIGYNEKEGYYHYDTEVYIKYLHQLQNLYYALTGEEIEVHL